MYTDKFYSLAVSVLNGRVMFKKKILSLEVVYFQVKNISEFGYGSLTYKE